MAAETGGIADIFDPGARVLILLFLCRTNGGSKIEAEAEPCPFLDVPIDTSQFALMGAAGARQSHTERSLVTIATVAAVGHHHLWTSPVDGPMAQLHRRATQKMGMGQVK